MASMVHVTRVPESREELQRSLEILGCDRACLSCYMCWIRRWLDEILGSYLPRVGNEMF